MIKSGLNPRLAEEGKIKIGGKGETRPTSDKKTTYQLPVRYNHFVITTTERDKQTGNYIINDKIMSRLIELYGNEPKEIPILFLFDDIDMNFHTSFSFYQGAKCICKGDGETATRLFTQSGEPKTVDIIEGDKKVNAGDYRKIICDPSTCPMMEVDKRGQTKCKPSGILSCILSPEINENVGGVYRFRTHSWNTVSNILASLHFIKELTGSGIIENGVLKGLPMKLQFLKKATQDHGNVSTVNVVFDGDYNNRILELAYNEKQRRTKYGINMKLLETSAKNSGFMTDTDDAKDIEDEFYSSVNREAEESKKNIAQRASTIIKSNTPISVDYEVQDDEEDPENKKENVKPDKKQPTKNNKKPEDKKEPEVNEPTQEDLDIF